MLVYFITIVNSLSLTCKPGITLCDGSNMKICTKDKKWVKTECSNNTVCKVVNESAGCYLDVKKELPLMKRIHISVKATENKKQNTDIVENLKFMKPLVDVGSQLLSPFKSQQLLKKSNMIGSMGGQANCNAARSCQGAQQAQAQQNAARQSSCGKQAQTCASSANQMQKAAQAQATQKNTAQAQSMQKAQANVSMASQQKASIQANANLSFSSKQASLKQADSNMKIAQMNQSMAQSISKASSATKLQAVGQSEQNLRIANENKKTEEAQAMNYKTIEKIEEDQANKNVQEADENKQIEQNVISIDKNLSNNSMSSSASSSMSASAGTSTSTSMRSSSVNDGVLVNLDYVNEPKDKTFDRVLRINDQDLILSEQRLATGEVANQPDDLLAETTIKQILPLQKYYRSNYSILKKANPNVILVKEPIAFKSFEDMKDFIKSREELLGRPLYQVEKYKEYVPERHQFYSTGD